MAKKYSNILNAFTQYEDAIEEAYGAYKNHKSPSLFIQEMKLLQKAFDNLMYSNGVELGNFVEEVRKAKKEGRL